MQKLKDFWHKNTKSKILIIFGAFIFLCFACVVLGTILPDPPEPTAEEIYTQAAKTLVAEYTQNAPTATIEPTSTPVPPEPTATTIESSDNQLYGLEIASIAEDYAKHMNNIGELMIQAGEDTTLLVNQDWIIKMSVNLVALELLADKIQIITAPPEMEATHFWMLKISDETYLLTDNLTYGIDNLDSAALTKATENINNINAYTEKATEEMLAVLAQ